MPRRKKDLWGLFMRNSKKAITFILSVIMMSSVTLSIASCQKPKDEEDEKKTVSEDDPWYTTRKMELVPNFSEDTAGVLYSAGPWLVDDKFVMYYSTYQGQNFANGSYSVSSTEKLIGIFDMDGSLLNMINVSDELSDVDQNYFGDILMAFDEGDNGIRFYFTKMQKKELYTCELDPDTGLISKEIEKIDVDLPQAEYSYVSSVNVINDYEVFQIDSLYYGKNHEHIVVAEDGKALYTVDFKDVFGPKGVSAVLSLIGDNNGNLYIEAYGDDQFATLKLDLATGQLTEVTDLKQISDLGNISITGDGKTYLTRSTGVFEYDIENLKEVCRLDFNSCDVNRYETQNSFVLYCDDNKVILGCIQEYEEYMGMPSPSVVYLMEKADKNPNAGKAVLTVADTKDKISYFESKALQTFNMLNQDYYAQMVSYDPYSYLSDKDSTEEIDGSDILMYSAGVMAGRDLRSDILSGEGPDVILGASGIADILDSEYLMDLKPYLDGESFSLSEFYTNVIDASETAGSTFFIPTAFRIAGIVTDSSLLDEEQKGFTYEQYASFVKEKLDGIEPATQETSRMHFMNMCIKADYAKWSGNGQAAFAGNEFKDLAVLFKDNVPEGKAYITTWEIREIENIGKLIPAKKAVYVEDIYSLASLAHVDYFHDNLKITGLPSKEGNGPSANITNSFSVTAGTKVIEGAYALLDLMLSKEIQQETQAAIPVNRLAVMAMVEKEKEHNRNVFRAYTSDPELVNDSLYREYSFFVPGSTLPDIFLQTIEEIDSVVVTDNAVMKIISEELPGYFLGQKDLDTVTVAVDSRIRTIFGGR